MADQTRGKTCPAVGDIIEEWQKVLEDSEGSPAIDAGLLAAAQAVEYSEILGFRTLKPSLLQLGKTDVADLTVQTLSEEIKPIWRSPISSNPRRLIGNGAVSATADRQWQPMRSTVEF